MTVLSIPRDTQVAIAQKGLRKINETNQLGGATLTAQTVSELLGGVPIDRYLRVNVQGVEKFIDALGGVTVFVPKDMKYNDFSQHLYINLKKGEQHLDGAKALQFLRYRYDGFGDIGRVQRQQIFMRALVEQSLKPQTLLRFPDIIHVVQSHIDTNVSLEELAALAGFASQTQRSDVQMLMLPGGFSGDGRHGPSYWLPNRAQIDNLVTQHFEIGAGADSDQDRAQDPAKTRVVIQDSLGDLAATRQMVRYLEKAGYRRIIIGEKWEQNLKTTRIIAQNGDDGGAAALRVSLGVGEVLVENTGNLASDISIQVGEDWRQKIPQLSF
jgi:LCP family protein required for cell wall assembly